MEHGYGGVGSKGRILGVWRTRYRGVICFSGGANFETFVVNYDSINKKDSTVI